MTRRFFAKPAQIAIVVSGSKTYVGSRSGTRSSASLNAGTSMSESTPKRSRTLAILSGEASSVSARLSGCTLGRSVMRTALNRLGWQGKERHKTLGEVQVSFDLDRFERRTAVNHGSN